VESSFGKLKRGFLKHRKKRFEHKEHTVSAGIVQRIFKPGDVPVAKTKTEQLTRFAAKLPTRSACGNHSFLGAYRLSNTCLRESYSGNSDAGLNSWWCSVGINFAAVTPCDFIGDKTDAGAQSPGARAQYCIISRKVGGRSLAGA